MQPNIEREAITAEMRRPLGIAIVGGLLLNQIPTLYTTPVIYTLLSKLHRKHGEAQVAASDASFGPEKQSVYE